MERNYVFFSNYVIDKIPNLLSIQDYLQLKKKIKSRNRKMMMTAITGVSMISLAVAFVDSVFGYILFLVCMLQIVTQSKYQNIHEPRGISMQVDDLYMLQFISAQLCNQEIEISKDVLTFIQSQIKTMAQYQFYKELIISIIINDRVLVDAEANSWIDKGIENILDKQYIDLFVYKNKIKNQI